MDTEVPNVSDKQWREKLTPEAYDVLRCSATEPPFSGKYVNEKTPGMYACAACGQHLFSSTAKYDSQSGWPSFYDVLDDGVVELRDDTSLGMRRTEVVCSNCQSHLGHLFDDGPADKGGQRYCINSLALDLQSDQ